MGRLAAIACVLLATHEVAADPASAAAAAAEAVRLGESGAFKDAAAKFREAYTHDPTRPQFPGANDCPHAAQYASPSGIVGCDGGYASTSLASSSIDGDGGRRADTIAKYRARPAYRHPGKRKGLAAMRDLFAFGERAEERTRSTSRQRSARLLHRESLSSGCCPRVLN
jgi:hypothetical protein